MYYIGKDDFIRYLDITRWVEYTYNYEGGKRINYTYDAWGACTVTSNTSGCNISAINPYRYRSYYYDTEIGLYYLQSRYYDPVVGRFINGDEPSVCLLISENKADINLFNYANNSPVVFTDTSGYSAVCALSAETYNMMLALSVAATSLMVSIKAFLAMIWNIFVVVGLLLIVIASLIIICKTIGNIYATIENVVTKSNKDDYQKKSGEICVYVLAREEKNLKSIFYVGRTKNILARYAKHKETKGNFFMYVVYVCSSEIQARVVEQCVLAGCLAGEYCSIIFGVRPSNMINGIAQRKMKTVIKDLGNELKDTLSLLGCSAENELLYMMEH